MSVPGMAVLAAYAALLGWLVFRGAKSNWSSGTTRALAWAAIPAATLILIWGGIVLTSKKSSDELPPKTDNDFVIQAGPGTDTTVVTTKFKSLVQHCPGIAKYKADIESVEYQRDMGSDFLVKVKGEKLSVLPVSSYGMGHTCHFSVDAAKATVSKRPCAWLCTGEDMTGVDGDNRDFVNGKLVGPLVRPWANLRQAIAATLLEMKDVRGGDVSAGAAKLAMWGHTQMKWAELQEIPLGKYGMVMKDPDTQRGSRICATGQVIEIAADTTIPQKIYLGGMYGSDDNLYRFVAVGSTGEIVANSRAKFCGIVTGQQHYPNSIGGEAHAVHLVGMFDLPENK